MDAKESVLKQVIIDRIHSKGPIPFCDFMEMSLYYPGLGYYTSGTDKIGKDGDYYTSPWLSSVYGEMLARQVEEMWNALGRKQFTIVEFGGGNGTLCRHILDQLQSNAELYRDLRYCIIEKKGRIPDEEKINVPGILSWHENIDDLPVVNNGCILSNELIDNFSVSQVVVQDQLMEVFVDYKEGFEEILLPANDDLKNYFHQLNVSLPHGYRTEINLEAINWIEKVATAMHKGFVLTVDYGFPSFELYSAQRSAGTLVCYYKHQVNFSPYQHIGEQDITTHVNFSALQHWGQKNQLDYCGFTNQANFLLGLGLTQHLRQKKEVTDHAEGEGQRALMLHTFLAGMGRKFKVLVQSKGLNAPKLSGLQFCLPGL
jgi:SAM-dependent MidA family methyltransferase